MCAKKLMGKVLLGVLVASIPALGQTASLRFGQLLMARSMLASNSRWKLFISNLPVELRGYQVGLMITGGTSGQITAAEIPDAVMVDETRANWIYREDQDGGEIFSVGG